jgi:ankyrin repeat protein
LGGHAHIVSLLLSMGADVAVEDSDGKTALELASSDAIRALLRAARPVAEQLALNAQLLQAVNTGQAAIVEQVLAHGGVFTEPIFVQHGSNGFFPLHLAAGADGMGSDLRMVTALLAAGADMEKECMWVGATPLIHAARRGHEDIVEALLDAGADMETVNAHCGEQATILMTTALGHAVEQGHIDVVVLLLGRGAKTSFVEEREMMTMLERANMLAETPRMKDGQPSAASVMHRCIAACLRLHTTVVGASSDARASASADDDDDDDDDDDVRVGDAPAVPAPEVLTLSSDDEDNAAPPAGAASAADAASALAAMTRRAKAAEAEKRRLCARVAELEHEARGARLGKRSAETHAAALRDVVGVKRERLESATATAATATAAAATATAAADTATAAAETATAAAATAAATATRAEDALEDATTCRVCFSEPRQMVFLPCFHLAVCAGCSDELRSRAMEQLSVAARRRGAAAAKPPCPVCRTEATSVVGPIFQA